MKNQSSEGACGINGEAEDKSQAGTVVVEDRGMVEQGRDGDEGHGSCGGDDEEDKGWENMSHVGDGDEDEAMEVFKSDESDVFNGEDLEVREEELDDHNTVQKHQLASTPIASDDIGLPHCSRQTPDIGPSSTLDHQEPPKPTAREISPTLSPIVHTCQPSEHSAVAGGIDAASMAHKAEESKKSGSLEVSF